MSNDWTAARGRRLLCLFLLIVGLALPMALQIFWEEDTPSLSYYWENQRRSIEAGVFFVDDHIHDANDETAARSSVLKTMMLLKQYRRIGPGDFNSMKEDHYLSNIIVPEFIEHQIVRKRSIHAIVTTIVALIVPLTAFLCALAFNRKAQRLNRTDRRGRRKERIVQGLKECRIKNNPCSPVGATTTADEERECPICLSAFAAGEIIIASKYCQCNTATNNNNKIQRRHRTFFHEECIVKWLSQRQTNPNKLCPCCRQPFLASSLVR